MDELAKSVAERTSRRGAVTGLGAVILGALGVLGVGKTADAAKTPCQKCKDTCRDNNRKKGKKNPRDCSKKCRNKC